MGHFGSSGLVEIVVTPQFLPTRHPFSPKGAPPLLDWPLGPIPFLSVGVIKPTAGLAHGPEPFPWTRIQELITFDHDPRPETGDFAMHFVRAA